jgi:hypothetical protein
VSTRGNVNQLPDEEGFVTIGPLHRFPTLAPHWEGLVPPADSSAKPVISIAGGSNNPKDKEAKTLGSKHGLEAEDGDGGAIPNALIFEDRYQPIPERYDTPAPK